MLKLSLSTLLLQTANFFIMVYILARFLFKPLKEILDKRASQATKAIDEAQKAATEAEALRQEYEMKRDNIEAEFAALKNEARIVIDHTRQQMLQEAYEEIEAMRARAGEEIEQQRTEALRLHRSRIGELVTALCQRMVKDVLSPELHQAYLDAFLEELRAIQLEGRISDNGEATIPAELITAIPLGEEEEDRITGRLKMAVSRPLDLTHRVDPNVLAGAMVRLGDMLIDGSLQGQLEQLRAKYEVETG
jgi:F-type H+-transporting ATPase subunit b